jgi:hypothetical protein
MSRNGRKMPFALMAEVTEVIIEMTKDNILEKSLFM